MIMLMEKENRVLKDELMSIYEECFNDGTVFTKHMFQTKLGLENVVAKWNDGNVASMLFLVPQKVVFENGAYDVPLIVGVATRKELRGKGFCGEIIKDALNKMNMEKKPFSMLSAFSNSFYEQFGFRTTYFGRELSLSKEKLISSSYRATEKDADLLEKIYNGYMQANSFFGYTQRDKTYFLKKLVEVKKAQAEIRIIKNFGLPAGYYITDLSYNELICKNPEFLQANDDEAIISFVVPSRAKDVASNMVRITNVEKAFETVKFLEKPLAIRIKVKDSIIRDNNCIIEIEKSGSFKKLNFLDNFSSCCYDYEISVEELANAFFGICNNDNICVATRVKHNYVNAQFDKF